MTITETTNYLLRIRRLQLLIWRLQLQHDELQSCLLPAAIRYDKDKVQFSPEDKLSDVAAEVIDIEARIRKLQEQKAMLIMEINLAINALPDDKESAILTAYYVNRMKMEEVADKVGYSVQHTYRLRRRGVTHLGEILEKDVIK